MDIYTGHRLINTAMRLWNEGLAPRLRLYSVSPDGRKMRVLVEISLESIETGIQAYAMDNFGAGYYCAKLFSTKYGMKILEGRLDFRAGRLEDLEDEGSSIYPVWEAMMRIYTKPTKAE